MGIKLFECLEKIIFIVNTISSAIINKPTFLITSPSITLLVTASRIILTPFPRSVQSPSVLCLGGLPSSSHFEHCFTLCLGNSQSWQIRPFLGLILVLPKLPRSLANVSWFFLFFTNNAFSYAHNCFVTLSIVSKILHISITSGKSQLH